MNENVFKLEEAGYYFFNEVFYQINEVLSLMVAGEIFGKTILDIEPESNDKMPSIPEHIIDSLNYNGFVLSEHTISKMNGAWARARVDAKHSILKLKRKDKINRIEVLGHIINLSLLVESSLNKQLFLLQESGEIENSIFKSLDRSEVLSKLMFIFKDQILNKSLKIDRIKHLVSLRNQAVHYKASSTKSIDLSIEDLLCIWEQIGELLELVDGHLGKADIMKHKNQLIEKWID
ncbi:MAG: hypothetical protein JEY94_17855 [Melioribacteraceae bacterium]|nr:hypothetical protein [Melioribacteraceae bacterium]